MKKKVAFALIFFFIFSINAFAQSNEDEDKVFIKVEKRDRATFPGGDKAWQEYVKKNLQYPKKAKRKKIEGTVIVNFIICKDGSICDVEAISGPEELREAATSVVKKSPNWQPAEQSGRTVSDFLKLPIEFKLSDKKRKK